MLSIKRIPFFINKLRTVSILNFRELLIQYYNNVKPGEFLKPPIENKEAAKIRVDINGQLDKINNTLLSAGIDPTLIVTPPPAIGGRIQSINVIDNLFLLHIHQITPINVIDFLDRGIGKYQNDYPYSIIRSFNPLYYLGLMLFIIGNIPFRLFEYAGFNVSRVEYSWLGKVFKFILEICAFLASVVTILQATNINIMQIIKNLLES